MTSSQSDPRHPLFLWLHRPLMKGAAVGYTVFAMGTLLGIWLAWLAWIPQSDDNPLVVLVLVWVIAGITHIFVRAFWRSCVISAFGSVLGYIVFAIVLTPDPFLNEMFGAGMIAVGLFGFVLSMVMGVPVVKYRRTRNARIEEGPSR